MLVVLACTGLAGCPSFGLLESLRATPVGTAQAAAATTPTALPRAPIDPVLAFISTARDDEVAVVQETLGGRDVRVVAGRAYNAASGRRCRRFSYGPVDRPRAARAAVACQGENGLWMRTRDLRIKSKRGTGG